MLTISYSRVKNSPEPLTHLEQELEIRPEFLTRSKDLLLEVKQIKFTADLFYGEPFVTGNFHVIADLVVPSSRSLQPVPYHEDFHFNENYSEQEATKEEAAENEAIVKVDDDKIDLQTAIEDNVLLRIPITILTKEEKEQNIFPEGKGWQVVSEDSLAEEKKQQVNPAFAKLKTLLEQDNDGTQDKK